LLIGIVLALVRVPIVAILFFSLWVAETFVLRVLPLRFLKRAVHIVLIRLLLGFMGFWSVDSSYAVSKRRNPFPSHAPGSGVPKGHVIVANHSSYIDVLYLAYQFSPVFTAAPNDWKDEDPVPTGVAQQQTLFQAIIETIVQPKRTAAQCVPFSAIIAKADGPVVLFPEGTTTNGNVLLGCIPVLTPDSLISADRLHILAFKYPHTDFSPIYTVGNFFTHVLNLCCQISNSIQVTYVIEKDIATGLQTTEGGDGAPWTEKVYNILAATMGRRRAQLTARSKHPFNTYWYDYKKQYKKTK